MEYRIKIFVAFILSLQENLGVSGFRRHLHGEGRDLIYNSCNRWSKGIGFSSRARILKISEKNLSFDKDGREVWGVFD